MNPILAHMQCIEAMARHEWHWNVSIPTLHTKKSCWQKLLRSDFAVYAAAAHVCRDVLAVKKRMQLQSVADPADARKRAVSPLSCKRKPIAGLAVKNIR